ncbi:P-loop ATPase, Sll1717 family [Aeromonas veronii]|uniref:P-loop ATPase, Sll1717 family n=1 Tax=Aeromonas veronii TaxID=654 RepID=UPI003CE671D2
MGILNWIKVGEVAAESDDNLHLYFYDTGVSREIISSNNKFLMLGRKGAGKTAVYQHLINPANNSFLHNDIVVPLSVNSYSWNAHALLANREKAAGFEQKDSWRFVLAVESINTYVKYLKKNDLPISKNLSKAENLLEKLFSSPTPSWFDILGEKLYKLSKVQLPTLDASSDDGLNVDVGSVSFEDISKDERLIYSLKKNIDGLTLYLERTLKEELKDIRIFLLFDRLDEGWVESSHNSCQEIISGLIHASDYFTREFSGKIRPVVFLREDIFLSLNINDKNKLLEDFGKTLSWTQDTLEKMLLKRINFYAKISDSPTVENIDLIFDRVEMRSRNRPKNYIISRTFYRPRDLICFMKRIIEMMREESQDDDEITDLDTLRAEDVYSAEPGYSEWLLSELRDEWMVQKPELFEHISIIQNIGYSIFSKESFLEKACASAKNMSSYEAREMLKFMFNSSVIGFKKADNKWRFKCNRPSQGFQDEDTYKIHPGLIRTLGLTESSEDISSS